ncbi:MAG TPA: ABC transporter ATP-binding protein [Candidatus Dormibacteraeota bacterium]|jgi:ABC-2 type transport system ATP-binding protein|nr:ABC transporter ATP-binding protein [Candidatus Dormibacteraeota bacterium]
MTTLLGPSGVRAVESPPGFDAAQPCAVEAAGVERRYRGGRGVGPVDVAVAAGEVMVLMGPNGAGKTTLLRLLATVDRPQRGRVLWSGGGDARVARRSLGLALDATAEEPSLSGMQAAYFWCRQWVADRGQAVRLCEESLRWFGLWDVRDEPVGAYSFGMRRRLALVQALAHRPRLALLDEPTAGLDPAGVSALLGELETRSLAGCATVVASNDPNFAAVAAHRVAFLAGGRLLQCASPVDLLNAVGAARVALLDAPGLDLDALRELAGVERVDASAGGAVVRYRDPAVLPRIVAAADHPGGVLRQVRLHEPDLADAFRELAGQELSPDPSSVDAGGRRPGGAGVVRVDNERVSRRRSRRS